MALFNTITSPNPLKGISSPSPKLYTPPSRTFTVSCHRRDGKDDNEPLPSIPVDRRGMLLGLGGLSMASQLPAKPAAATPTPANLMDLPKYNIPQPKYNVYPAGSVDYEFPDPSTTPLRVRKAAHLVDDDYIAKYNEAFRRMKSLPDDHPWNLYNLAANHYMPAHDNWLFLPWHRCYIYFYERILGKLIGDPSFAIPYWNFDSGEGMSIPAMFVDPRSSFFNPSNDARHFPPQVIDFWYHYGAPNPRSQEERAKRVEENIKEIRKTYRQSLQRAALFMGDPHPREGEEQGSCGRYDGVHKAIHQWVGPPELPWMDMGNPMRTTRDPIFYAIHANMDRMWQLYNEFRGGGLDFDDDRWLNFTFSFCDENGRLVRVKVRDCLDPLKMSYTYQDVPIPWAGSKSTAVPKPQPKTAPSSLVPVGQIGPGPVALKSAVRFLVKRPKVSRSNVDKALEIEVLHLNGIDVVPSGPTRFDVYVAGPYGSNRDMAGPDYGEFVGSFVKPLKVKDREEMLKLVRESDPAKRKKGCLKLGITSILEDLDIEDAENLVVTIVHKDGEVTLDDLDITYLEADRPLLL